MPSAFDGQLPNGWDDCSCGKTAQLNSNGLCQRCAEDLRHGASVQAAPIRITGAIDTLTERKMKPFMMKFRQGKGSAERDIYVNMSQVCYITTDGVDGSVLTFAAVLQDEPAYICVNESPDEIGKRPEWHQ